jgi:3D (Asp-Asp-Asp) domain-containing protein
MLAKSFRWRVVVAAVAAVALVVVAESTLLDSRYAARNALVRVSTAPAEPGAQLRFIATAYCKGTITRSGIPVRSGMAAGDPSILPLGSVIRVESAGAYNGLYTILDTGPAIQGRMIDIYMWSCYEALAFGRRPLDITILRLGWKPVDSASDRIDAAFRQREREWRPKSLYSRPLNLNAPAER